MKEALSIALVIALGLVLAVGAALWHVIDEAGPQRVYSDLARWVLMVTLIVGGIAFLRVLLHGLGRLAADRNAHKAQLVQRERIIERHTIDGRQQAPQIVTIDRPADLRQLYPDMARAAIESGRPAAQIEAPDAYPVELPAADVWAQLETLFRD